MLSPYFVPFKKKNKLKFSTSHERVSCNKRKTGRNKHLPLWPMFAELSLLTLAHLNCHDPQLRLVSVIPISGWRPVVLQKILEKKRLFQFCTNLIQHLRMNIPAILPWQPIFTASQRTNNGKIRDLYRPLSGPLWLRRMR